MLDTTYLKFIHDVCLDVAACGGNEVVCAGGAIRDYLLDKPVKDIDIFYRGTLHSGVSALFKDVEDLFIKYEDSSFTLTHNVKALDTYKSVPIQLIRVDKGYVLEHVDAFPTPLSSVWYDALDGLVVPANFIKCVEEKKFKFKENTDVSYASKLKAKYPGFT